MINGYDAFKLFQACRLHFTVASYNYAIYNGHTKVNEESFNNRKDKYMFHKLARLFSEYGELTDFIVANLVNNSSIWVKNLLSPEAQNIYREWKNRTSNMADNFVKELSPLIEKGNKESFNSLFTVESGYPKLLDEYLHYKVSVETMVILDSLLSYLKRWDKTVEDDIIYPLHSMRIRKYNTFLRYDRDLFMKSLKQLTL